MATCANVIGGIWGSIQGYHRLAIRSEAMRNQQLGYSELLGNTQRLLKRRVSTAIQTCPAYARKVKLHCGDIGQADALPLDNLPLWTKEDQRTLWNQGSPITEKGAIAHSTGGSTGVPTQFYMTRESYEWRTAVSDRGYGWAGAEEGRRSYYVWGVPITPPSRLHQLKSAIHHRLQHRKYIDSFDFSDARKRLCCSEIDAFQPKAIVGYAGNLVDLALFVRQNPDALTWRSESVVTAADGLRPGQSELIEETLGHEVFLTYGSREFMLIGAECPEHRGYHLSVDNLWVELVDEKGKPVPPGESGRILVTDLHNTATPFIRYEIGDVGVMAADPCPCGLPFPMLARVDGRIQERIQLPGGESLTALFIPHLMKEFEWVRAYQVRQLSDSEIVMDLVTDEPLKGRLTDEIVRHLQPRVGNLIRISCVRVSALQKSSSGKTPIVVQGERQTGNAKNS